VDASDLLVIGGGVMGRFTAYHASRRGARVVVLERGRLGDPATASFGRTRSFRNDYLDPAYARLAHESFRLWGDFERETGATVLVRCGCMNLGKRSVTPDLERTYAQQSFSTLQRLGLDSESFHGDALRARFPYLDADLGRLDVDAGVVDVRAVDRALARGLGERGCC
jgi:glycine/D-amino acid oxidase-like deaminating enzyme